MAYKEPTDQCPINPVATPEVELAGSPVVLFSTGSMSSGSGFHSRQKPGRLYKNWFGRQILIVEDEELNYLFLNEVLSRTKADLL